VVFDKLLNVASFGLYFELGFGLSQEVGIKGFFLFLGFGDNFLFDDGPMIFDIIEFKWEFRDINFTSDSIIPLMWRPGIGLIESLKKIIIECILISFGNFEWIDLGIGVVMGFVLVEFGEGFTGPVEIAEDGLHLALFFWGEGVKLTQIALYMHELNLCVWL
jgi:hypothetical protein